MEFERAPKVRKRFEKQFAQRIKPDLVSLCPTLDLVAVATTDRQLDVFRFNGERAFGRARDGLEVSIDLFEWKWNGSALNIAWSDKTLDLLDAHHGQVRKHVLTKPPNTQKTNENGDEQSGRIKCVSSGLVWTEANVASASTLQNETKTNSSVEEDILDEFDTDSVNLPDFPRDLALLDFESDLPLLNALPELGDGQPLPSLPPNEALWTDERQSVLGLNVTYAPSRAIDVTLEFHKGGPVNVSIFDCPEGELSFVVPEIWLFEMDLDLVKKDTNPLRNVMRCASCPSSTIFALLEAEEESKHFSLRLLDFKGLRTSSPYFTFVLHKEVALNNLCLYIRQCVVSIRETWKENNAFPKMTIGCLEGFLEEDHKMSIRAALFHLAVTGEAVGALDTFFGSTLTLGDLKRWDQHMVKAYTEIISLVHENLLPALERASIVASRLRGLSRVPDLVLLNLKQRNFDRIVDGLDKMRLIAHYILTYAGEEYQLFTVFSAWIGHQIEVRELTEDSAAKEEAAEKAASVDHTSLLRYVDGPLLESHLNIFLSRPVNEILDAPRPPEQQVSNVVLQKVLTRHRDQCLQPARDTVEIVDLLYQSLFLDDDVCRVNQLAEANFQKDIRLHAAAHDANSNALASGQCRVTDMRMNQNADGLAVYVLGTLKDVDDKPDDYSKQLVLYRYVIGFDTRNEAEGSFDKPLVLDDGTSVDGHKDWKIFSPTFVDNEKLLYLAERPETTALVLQSYPSTLPKPIVLTNWTHRDGFVPASVDARQHVKEARTIVVVVTEKEGTRYQILEIEW